MKTVRHLLQITLALLLVCAGVFSLEAATPQGSDVAYGEMTAETPCTYAVTEEYVETYSNTNNYFRTLKYDDLSGYDDEYNKYSYGTLKKTFSAPESFLIEAEFSSYGEGANAFTPVLSTMDDLIADNFGYEVTEPLITVSLDATIYINIAGLEQVLSYDYFYEYTEADGFTGWNGNFSDFNWLNSVVLSVSTASELTALAEFQINACNDDNSSNYYTTLVFELEPLELLPIEDGSLIALNSNYWIEGDFAMYDLVVTPVGTVFATAGSGKNGTTPPCYIVSDESYGLPNSNYTLSFIYNGTVGIDATNNAYSMQIDTMPEVPYTMQGKLVFLTTDGVEHTLYTNVVTLRKHELTLKIDGTTDLTVGRGAEHEYSFVFDNNDIEDMVVLDAEWMFDVGNNVFNSDSESTSTEYVTVRGEKATAAFDALGRCGISLFYEATYNDGHEAVMLQAYMFWVNVVEADPVRVQPNYEVKFSISEGSAALIGGDPFTVSASINEPFGDEHFVLDITATGNAIGVLSTEENSITLLAVSPGRAVIYCSAVSATAGTYSKSLLLDVVESTEENTSIVFKDDFNKTGNDLIAYLNVDGYTSFLNYKPEWKVQTEDGENLVDVAFTTDETGAAIISGAGKGYYYFSSIGTNVVTTEAQKRVSDINFAAFARDYLPYIAAVMVVGILLVILMRLHLKRRYSLGGNLTKMADSLGKLAASGMSREKFRRAMASYGRELKKCYAKADELDHDTLGQYQSVCGMLSEAMTICRAGEKSADKLTKSQMKTVLRNLKTKYVERAAKQCNELAKESERYGKSVTPAEVTVPKGAEKKPEQDEYLAMLKNFYRKGDDEDDNGRDGDSDRDGDDGDEG